jgi:hypothetical protein
MTLYQHQLSSAHQSSLQSKRVCHTIEFRSSKKGSNSNGLLNGIMKSPIKNKPLINPGQSLDRYLPDVVFDQDIIYIFIGTFTYLFAFTNWAYYFTQTVPNLWAMTLIVIAVVLYCLYKVKKTQKKIERLKQGRDGESAGKDVDVKKLCCFLVGSSNLLQYRSKAMFGF